MGSTNYRGLPLVAPPPFGKGRLPRLCLGMLAPVGRSRVPPGGSTLACWCVGPQGKRSRWRSGGRLEGGATSGPAFC
ncbi:MAG TPA: hypothetical protein VH599_20115 [Ktedonobacterales bacterium]